MPLASTSGGGGKSGDVRAGGAYVEISAKDQLSKTLLSLKAKAAAFAAGLQAIGRNVTFVGAVAFAPLAALFKTGLGRAEEAEKMAEEMGYTVKQMQQLKYAADVAGVSVEDVLRKPEKYGHLMKDAPILDGKQIKEAVEAQRAFRAAIIDLQNALAPLASALVPVIRGIAEFVKANPELARVLFVVAAAATVLGPVLIGVGAAITALLSPIGLMIAGVAALGAGVGYLASAVFPTAWGQMKSVVGESLGGIVAAIAKADFGLALEIAGAGMTAAWKVIVAEMTHVWVGFKNVVVDTFKDMLASLKYTMGTWEGFDTFVLPGGGFRNLSGIVDPDSGSELAKRSKARQEQQIADRRFRDQQIAAANADLEATRKRLGVLVAKAKEAGAPGGPDEPLAKRITAVRGAFRILSDANQQFGGSEGKRTSEQIREMVEQQRITNKLLEEAAKNMRFK